MKGIWMRKFEELKHTHNDSAINNKFLIPSPNMNTAASNTNATFFELDNSSNNVIADI